MFENSSTFKKLTKKKKNSKLYKLDNNKDAIYDGS